MTHIHDVYDSDRHFSIDKDTRQLKNQNPEKTSVMQFDHNSERITFDLPRKIDGHDMSTCNVVEVHFLNTDARTKEKNPGIYPVADLMVSPTDPETVICSWLVSIAATKLVGPLAFRLTFKCSADGGVDYAWSTAIFKDYRVSDGINNTEIAAEEYIDLLAQWREIITSAAVAGAAQSAQAAATSEKNAKTSETGAAQSAQAAATSEKNAKTSETNAAQSAAEAKKAAEESGGGSGVDVTAKPGQLIRVQSVDENGKPTAWEPVPFGWTEKGEIAELPLVGEWGGEDADGDGITDSAMFVASAPIGLVVDNTYTVKCNGTDYTVNALDLNSLSGGEMPGVFLGNLAGTGGEDTGEPFMVMEIPEELSAEMNGLYGMIQVMGAVESFSIYGQSATHHKIPNKFIDGNWVKNTVAPAIETAKSEAVTEANGYTDTKLNELKVEVPLFDVNALLPKNFKYGDEYNTSSADETLFRKIHDAGIVKVRIPDNIFGHERFITVYPVVSPNDVGISLIIPGNTILGESLKGKILGVIDIRYNYSILEIKTGKISVSATS